MFRRHGLVHQCLDEFVLESRGSSIIAENPIASKPPPVIAFSKKTAGSVHFLGLGPPCAGNLISAHKRVEHSHERAAMAHASSPRC